MAIAGGVLVSFSVSVSGPASDERADYHFVAERAELFRQVDVELGTGKLCAPAGTALLGSSLRTMMTSRSIGHEKCVVRARRGERSNFRIQGKFDGEG